MVELEATIQNEAGIHCRPTAVILQAAARYDGTVTVYGEHGTATLTSALELMVLALEQGAHIRIRVEGPDEAETAAKFKDLFEYNFDFPPREGE